MPLELQYLVAGVVRCQQDLACARRGRLSLAEPGLAIGGKSGTFSKGGGVIADSGRAIGGKSGTFSKGGRVTVVSGRAAALWCCASLRL